MRIKVILGCLSAVLLVFVSPAHAGRVELTTAYPAAYGEYTTLQSSGNSNFATVSGSVGIGTTTPAGKLHIYDVNGVGMTMDAGPGTAGTEESAFVLLTLGNGVNGVGNASTKGWAFDAKGNSYATVAQRNDFMVYYWNGSTWNFYLYIDSATLDIGIGTTAPTDVIMGASDVTIGGGGSIVQDGWTTPAFQNSWVNYGAPYNTAGYFRDKNGIVHLRGLVKSGALGTIFNLPAGYRPAYQELYGVVSSSGAMSRVDIDTSGNVAANAGGNVWFQLDGISFRASGY